MQACSLSLCLHSRKQNKFVLKGKHAVWPYLQAIQKFLFHHFLAITVSEKYSLSSFLSKLLREKERKRFSFCRFWFKHELGIKSNIWSSLYAERQENIKILKTWAISKKEATAIWKSLQKEDITGRGSRHKSIIQNHPKPDKQSTKTCWCLNLPVIKHINPSKLIKPKA